MSNQPPESQPSEQPPRRPHPLELRHQPQPEAEDQPRQRMNLRIPSVKPRVMYILIALNVLVFVIRLISPAVDYDIFLWGANHPRQVLLDAEYYRLFSAMFLHASIYTGPMGGFAPANALHLIFNMYILYAVGLSLEPLFGYARFAIIYFLGGLAASVASTVLGGLDIYSVGASGAVFAILGAEFVYLYHHRRLMGAAGAARRRSLIIFAFINLMFGLASTLPGAALRVDNWGHLGGLLGGSILAWFISPILNIRAHPDHPGELLGEDINPLRNRVWVVSIYGTVLVIILFIRVFAARA